MVTSGRLNQMESPRLKDEAESAEGPHISRLSSMSRSFALNTYPGFERTKT